MNIFNQLKVYASKFVVSNRRSFTSEEINSVVSAIVVPSEYGNSACFTMKSGGKTYIPMSTNATIGAGETVDLAKAEILTLTRGDEEIVRIEI